MKFRPEAEIWPLMTEAELAALAADIAERGQQYPISLYRGAVLDGRNRWLAIERLGNLEPKCETVEPASPIAFVISRNEKRRHMSDSQRAHVSAKSLPFFEAEAKARMRAGGRSHGKGAPIGAPLRRAAADAAEAFGTSPRNVERGKAVLQKGSGKLNEAVAAGQLSLGKAEQIVKTYPEKRKQDVQVAVIAKSKMATRVKGLTGEIEWYTPRRYLDAAIAVMGAIDLDPASSESAQEHVKASRYFTLETDGLAQPWKGRVFLNPPYATQFVKPFVAKMVESARRGTMTEGILLTNNATDTEWFHQALRACTAVCFTKGRIAFLEASEGELTEKPSPTHGQAFFYFGPKRGLFIATFEALGGTTVTWAGRD